MQELNMAAIEKTLEALRRNRMEAYYCPTAEDARTKVQELMEKGATVTHGGSVTLTQCGIRELLQNGDYHYLDRSVPGLTREQVEEIYRKAVFSDVYLTSANAITEDGKLFNVDGNCNRVAAILYGPKSVIVVAGYNKIVKNLEEAFDRLRTVASPLNTQRLKCDTYCAKTGKCVSLNQADSTLGDGCRNDQRICCSYTVCAQQRQKDRIKVILVGESLGY